ncbi:Fic family protein [Magnetospirillum sp. J10]|uniref:Fic family protein n=1 Tax=Magnetospirillum sulfuroxidans TaxID=611300 RepID=A0ABS5IE38_9PROT|nr:Fic family protein [Magnetospirillum sulfuroxidans]
MAVWIWREENWPNLTWDAAQLLDPMVEAARCQGLLLGRVERLGFDLRCEAELKTSVEDVIQTSAIEGEKVDHDSVRSSLARRLGLPDGGLPPADRKVEGLVEITLDATRNYSAPLTQERLFGWHAALFPTGYSGLRPITLASWRTDAHGPMQVVSGPLGRERIHYEAPPAILVPTEMERFLDWFNGDDGPDSVMKSGLAHLWFVTIHPFDDGNGRIARTIADLALAKAERTGQRFYSMSSQIMRERDVYYQMLEKTQRGDIDVTRWLSWFVGCYTRAIQRAETMIADVLIKAEFWQSFAHEPLSERQKKVLNRFLDGFEGSLTAKKWAALAKCSIDTAQRDINDLLERKLLVKGPGGSKNTCYWPAGYEDRPSGE